MRKIIALLAALLFSGHALPNDFYNASGIPSTGAPLVSSTIRNEFANIGTAFNKMPTLAGNGNQVVLVNAGGTGLTVAVATALPGMVIGTNLQAWSAQLDSLAALATNGLIARTAANTVTARTLTGTTAEITVTNGDGVSGAPTLSLPASMTFTGKTVTGGTYASPALTTPTLGVATATSINKMAITAPATSSTLAVADGKTLTANNTLTLAGTDSTTLTFQGTDTYVGRTTSDTLTNKTLTNFANTTQALTDGATVNWDTSLGAWATWTIGGNRTLAAPTNLKAGGRYTILLTQDGTGGRLVTWNAVFKGLYGATMPQPNAAAGSVTIFNFESDAGTNLYLVNLGKQQTRQVFTSGTSATYTTPAGATRINIRIAGGASSGSVGGNAQTSGNAGTATTFGALTANGGGATSTAGQLQPAAATASGGDINISGGLGEAVINVGAARVGAVGAAGPWGGQGGGGAGGSAAYSGAPNSGAGGGGGSSNNAASAAGQGGNAGAYCEKLIISPAATYTYTVGPGGASVTGNANGSASGAGAAGIIIVDEFYN